MTLKEYLLMLEPDTRVWIFGKNNLPFSSWTAGLYLSHTIKSEIKMMKSKVLYEGLDDHNETVVVINKKVRIFK